MGNKNINQKNSWIYIGGALLVFALLAFYLNQHGYSSFLANILQFIVLIVTIKLAKRPSSSIQCNNKNKVQEEDSNEKQNDEAEKTVQNNWWKRNRRRIFISLAINFAIIFVASFCYNLHDYRKQQKELLLQQQYDALVDNYEKRMEQPIFFEDAYELLVKDSIMLVQITQMLEKNPNLKVDTTDYSKQFENRVGKAIENINYAIFVLGLPHDDSLKYTKQKDNIKKMINSL